MATRPVFMPSSKPPYRTAWNAEFIYNGGFAVSQKQKNITAAHNALHASFPDKSVILPARYILFRPEQIQFCPGFHQIPHGQCDNDTRL